MKPEKRTLPIRRYMRRVEAESGQALMNKELAKMAGVTAAVITRVLQSKDRIYEVEELGPGRVQIWERLPAPWRKVLTRKSAPKKWRGKDFTAQPKGAS